MTKKRLRFEKLPIIDEATGLVRHIFVNPYNVMYLDPDGFPVDGKTVNGTWVIFGANAVFSPLPYAEINEILNGGNDN